MARSRSILTRPISRSLYNFLCYLVTYYYQLLAGQPVEGGAAADSTKWGVSKMPSDTELIVSVTEKRAIFLGGEARDTQQWVVDSAGYSQCWWWGNWQWEQRQ